MSTLIEPKPALFPKTGRFGSLPRCLSFKQGGKIFLSVSKMFLLISKGLLRLIKGFLFISRNLLRLNKDSLFVSKDFLFISKDPLKPNKGFLFVSRNPLRLNKNSLLISKDLMKLSKTFLLVIKIMQNAVFETEMIQFGREQNCEAQIKKNQKLLASPPAIDWINFSIRILKNRFPGVIWFDNHFATGRPLSFCD